jgi:CHAD domain-containing protein
MRRAITRADRAGKAREKFARWAHSLAGVREPDVPLINAALQVLHLRVDEAIAMGHVLQSHDEEEQHNLRKSLRRLRYTLEAFGPAFEKPKPRIKKLTAMQDVLGEMQDRSVLRAMLCQAYKWIPLRIFPMARASLASSATRDAKNSSPDARHLGRARTKRVLGRHAPSVNVSQVLASSASQSARAFSCTT